MATIDRKNIKERLARRQQETTVEINKLKSQLATAKSKLAINISTLAISNSALEDTKVKLQQATSQWKGWGNRSIQWQQTIVDLATVATTQRRQLDVARRERSLLRGYIINARSKVDAYECSSNGAALSLNERDRTIKSDQKEIKLLQDGIAVLESILSLRDSELSWMKVSNAETDKEVLKLKEEKNI